RNGTINIIARSEGRDFHYDLVQFRRVSGGDWTFGNTQQPHRVIAAARRKSYAAWRHQVTEAPDGSLYLNFSYFPNKFTDMEAQALSLDMRKRRLCDNHSPQRCWYPDAPDLNPRTLVSRDDGLTWH